MRAIVGAAACARQGHLGWTCYAGRKHVSPQQADDNRGDRLRAVPSSPKMTKTEEVMAMVGYLRLDHWFTPGGRRRPGGLRPTGHIDGQEGTLYVSALTPPLGKLAQFLAYLRR
jgi:hypothetical protein